MAMSERWQVQVLAIAKRIESVSHRPHLTSHKFANLDGGDRTSFTNETCPKVSNNVPRSARVGALDRRTMDETVELTRRVRSSWSNLPVGPF
ncbi:uncharacterized protein RCC_06492 [Ramularia collo-cygni]|uniref:Uncharacterized protein n=1 Tax=Ramularia collo-cygni TaxID=112498 RepID=A0A2D3V1M9_9PEZI|nr:uncharacterized protein RCC_06492 [Ramularia collo-cygni]CZT20635.1 uncharacterized protein RCC_06492 [Ramularia collo-cygni]